MLYEIYDAHRVSMQRLARFAEVAGTFAGTLAAPWPQGELARRVAAGYQLAHRIWKHYDKPAFGIAAVEVAGQRVTVDESVVLDRPFCELRLFGRRTAHAATGAALRRQPAVLVVALLSGHHATLLRDTVREMLRDHQVYITDWKDARQVPLDQGVFHLHDYVDDVRDFIRYLQQVHGQCHVLSVCQPTVPTLAAVSLMATGGEPTPLSMTMMGGPIDARRSPTAVNNLAASKSYDWFERNVIHRVPAGFPGAGRRVYPGFLQHAGFIAMNPARHVSSHWDYFEHLVQGDQQSAEAHRQFYDEYNAVLDMDAHYYLETIRTVFQEFALANGTWDLPGPDGALRRVRPQDIRDTALLTVEGELDDISGAGQTAAAHALCARIPAARKTHIEVAGAGHYGIFSGRRWRETVYPRVRDFIAAAG